MNSTKRLARKRFELLNSPSQQAKSSDPVSIVGMIAVFAAMSVFTLDLITHAHAAIGILFVLSLTLLSNESPKTIVLFGGITSVLLLVNLILLNGAQVAGIVPAEKIVSLVGIAGITVGLVRHRLLEEKVNILLKRELNIIPLHTTPDSRYVVKPHCVIKQMKEVKERKAMPKELKGYISHRKKSLDLVDPYTRDLVLFIYAKSVKN